MKNLKIVYFLTLLIIFSCRDKEAENDTLEKMDYPCRDAEVINKASYSDMTEIQVLAYRRDSLITEAGNLILCEECETTDWKWTSHIDCDSSITKHFFYSENTDTVALFEIINQYQESSRISEYFIGEYDTVYFPQVFPCVLLTSNEIPSHVECRKGIPILKMKNK